jgi:ABC-type phosphate transport system substrate-binding protein/HAMP domain-containing protein
MDASEMEICQGNGHDLIEFIIGTDAIAIVTSKENSFLSNLTLNQLAQIFSSAQTWSEVDANWPNEPIVRLVPNIETGTFSFFTDKVHNGDIAQLMKARNISFYADQRQLLDDLLDDPYAIGFTSLGDYPNSSNLKVLTINNSLPKLQTIETGEYYLSRPLFIYTDKAAMQNNPAAASFVYYVLAHVNEEIESLGYFPLRSTAIELGMKKWKDMLDVVGEPVINPGEYSGVIRIDGSSTIYPIVSRLADRFKGEGFRGDIIVASSSTGNGVKSFCATGNIDFFNASHEISNKPSFSTGGFVTDSLLKSEQQTYFQLNYAGQDSLVSVASIKDIQNSDYIDALNWKVVVYNNTKDALAPIQAQRRASIAILLLVATVSTAGALGLAHLLSSPLRRLGEVAQKFGAGDLDVRARVESEDEIGTLAGAFNDMANQLRKILSSLEKQVAERTQAVLTSAEVSRRLSTILDQHQLLLSVVEEIQHAFHYYHAQIYLFDNLQENLVMVGGTGEAGQIMMARGHKIARGKGLVGRAAELNSPVLVADTAQDPDWLPNTLLPDTKSEVAIPITMGEQVLGVLDILRSISAQVAIAVQNARLFNEAQRQADREALILTINQKVQAEMTLEKVLEAAARELGLALSLQKATIQIEARPEKTPGNGK